MGEFGTLNFSVGFKKTSAFPLDVDGYFISLEDAQLAASTAVEPGSADSVYYIGLTLTVVEGENSRQYIILPDKTLKSVISEDVYINDTPPTDGDYKLFVDTNEDDPSVVEIYTKTETDSKLNLKQDVITNVQVSVDNNVGVPSGIVTVNKSNISFAFKNLKGEPGEKGDAFTYDDFTPELIQELQKPATDAAATANLAAESATLAALSANQATESANTAAENATAKGNEAVLIATDKGNEATQIATTKGEEAVQLALTSGEEAKLTADKASQLAIENSKMQWFPSVDSEGNLTWSRNSSETAPASVNIKGPQGNSGATGSTDNIVVVNDLNGGESTAELLKVLAAELGKVLNEKISNISNYRILEWKTDAATTRKQVAVNERKKLLQISYENGNGYVVNEQYIGTSFTDTDWVKDDNWVQIAIKDMLGDFDKKADELIVDNSSVAVNSGFHNSATTTQVNSSYVYTDMFEVYPNSTIYCTIKSNVFFYSNTDKNSYYQFGGISLEANTPITVPKDCFFMLITFVGSQETVFSIKYKYDFNTNVAEIQKKLDTLDEECVKKDIKKGDKFVQYNELVIHDGHKASATTIQDLTGWKYTDKIPAYAGSKLHTNKGIKVYFYKNELDSSYISISSTNPSKDSDFDVPDGTNYILISFSVSDIKEDLLISYAESYYPKPEILQKQITENKLKVDAVPLSELDEIYVEVSSSDFKDGFLNPNGGIQTGLGSWGYYETYIPVSPKITYKMRLEVFTGMVIVEYDKNLNQIQNIDPKDNIFIPTENTRFIRFTGTDYRLEGGKVKFMYDGIFFKPFQEHDLTNLQMEEMYMFQKFSQGLFKSINRRSILTLVDDDCFWDNYNNPHDVMNIKSLCDERNIRCTFACITKNWTEENWKTMIEWQQQGYHFVSHSYTHWDTSTDAKLEEEFARPLSDLTQNGAVHCDYFVYPFGGLSGQTDKANKLSQRYYKCSVTTAEGINRFANRNKFQLFRLMYSDSLTDEKFNGYIDDLSANSGWLIFGSHSGDLRETYWNTERYKTMLDYALSKENIEVMTLHEAWELYKLYYMYKDLFIE